MKYKFGDLVYHIPTFCIQDNYVSPLQILGYDEKMKKYKCMDFDLGYLYEVLTIWYCNENELNYLKSITEIEQYLVNGKIPFPNSNIDDTYYEHYDINGKEVKLVRKPIRQRKPFNVPLK